MHRTFFRAINKIMSAEEAVADIRAGSTLLIGGFGACGSPHAIVAALANRDVGNFSIFMNAAALPVPKSTQKFRKIRNYETGWDLVLISLHSLRTGLSAPSSRGS